ncbi:MAG: family 20 glycosylhydrolase [Verrucomicrobiota bacterium]|nr:family 20 glycosylhydrolase [Verrucomicrobiota bacterium]
MIAFQFNLTVGHCTEKYLKKWLKILAENNYDTIIWEIEDAVVFDTCPDVAAVEAFTKTEFKSILDYSSELGLNNIPLLQTMAHNAYVLKHKQYFHLADHPGFIELYCPLNPDVHTFLNKLIAEYVEFFGNITHFHLGCDEAWALGGKYCDGECKEYMKTHSISDLFTQHLLKLTKPLIEQKITPIIWADMVMKHDEMLEMLPKEIMLFDWMYQTKYHGDKVWDWEIDKLCSLTELSNSTKEKYKDFLFLDKDQAIVNPFYSSQFLKSQGFKVVGCSASASYGDNVFSLRNKLHTLNSLGWFNEYMSNNCDGYVLTSWTVHLFPYEMQLAQIMIPEFVSQNSKGGLVEFQKFLTLKLFGIEIINFFDTCELIAGNVLFSYTASLGFNTCIFETPDKHIQITLEKLATEGNLQLELDNCYNQLINYKKALIIFKEFHNVAIKGDDILDLWILQTENLINRAEISALILTHKIAEDINEPESPKEENLDQVISKLKSLKIDLELSYQSKIKPCRRGEIIGLLFDPILQYIIK